MTNLTIAMPIIIVIISLVLMIFCLVKPFQEGEHQILIKTALGIHNYFGFIDRSNDLSNFRRFGGIGALIENKIYRTTKNFLISKLIKSAGILYAIFLE